MDNPNLNTIDAILAIAYLLAGIIYAARIAYRAGGISGRLIGVIVALWPVLSAIEIWEWIRSRSGSDSNPDQKP